MTETFWETQLAAALGGAAITLLGVVVTAIFTSKQAGEDRKSREAQAELDREATKQLADRERKQQRLADAYIEALDLCGRVAFWASQLRPILAPSDYEPPDPPPIDEQLRVRAKLAAYGSSEVQRLYEDWSKAVHAVVREDGVVRHRLEQASRHANYTPTRLDEDLSWKDATEPWARIHDEHLPELKRATEALQNAAAKELGSAS